VRPLGSVLQEQRIGIELAEDWGDVGSAVASRDYNSDCVVGFEELGVDLGIVVAGDEEVDEELGFEWAVAVEIVGSGVECVDVVEAGKAAMVL
jgi:hypothetical protein